MDPKIEFGLETGLTQKVTVNMPQRRVWYLHLLYSLYYIQYRKLWDNQTYYNLYRSENNNVSKGPIGLAVNVINRQQRIYME